MSDHVLLTDDEVVALAAGRSDAWPGGLPTIDANSREELVAAAFRGSRSLLVRRTGAIGGPDPVVESIADSVLGALGRVVVYLGNQEFRRASWGLSSLHHCTGDGWLLETISPVGIHSLGLRPVEEHRAYLAALLRGAIDAGPDQEVGASSGAESEWLCMLGEGPARSVLAVARRGVLLIGDVDVVEGWPRVSKSLEPSNPKTAIGRLVASVDRSAGTKRAGTKPKRAEAAPRGGSRRSKG